MTIPQRMQALQLIEPAKPPPSPKERYDPIKVETVPLPDVPEGHVLIRLHAAALNHRDVYIREGNYPGVQYNSILGSDGAGIIVKTNPPNDPKLMNKRVMLSPSVGWESDKDKPENIFEFGLLGHLPLPGTFAEYISVKKEMAVEIPTHLSFVEAAAFPVAGVTAFRSVFTLGNLKRGQKVLIPGIGGGVALFALQFALAAGAEVYVTSSSDEKLRMAREMGASGGVNYKNDDWVQELESETGGFFDLVVDGAAGPNVKAYTRLLGPGGILVVYGAVSGSNGNVNFPYLWFKHLTIKGACMGSLEEFNDMAKFIEKNKIKPTIAGVFDGLKNAEKAFDVMRRGTQFGKLLIDLEKGSSKI
ncbi:hypothetical protein HDU97_000807 [Phlyctochytrium planicorne]|nr:hypothetical protein HDU97_000807 [Phlyctochytrium planicorne]